MLLSAMGQMGDERDDDGAKSAVLMTPSSDSPSDHTSDYHRHSVGDASDTCPSVDSPKQRVECRVGRCICTDNQHTQQVSTQARLANAQIQCKRVGEKILSSAR